MNNLICNNDISFIKIGVSDRGHTLGFWIQVLGVRSQGSTGIRATGSEMKSLAFGVLRFPVGVLDVQDGELGVSVLAALAVIGFGLRIREGELDVASGSGSVF